MLTVSDLSDTSRAATPDLAESHTPNGAAVNGAAANVEAAKPTRGLLARMLRLEWLGQTVASLCWIASVFAYGSLSTAGDWLQLCAASAWLLANIASVASSDAD